MTTYIYLTTEGSKSTASKSALLQKLDIEPFTHGMNGSPHAALRPLHGFADSHPLDMYWALVLRHARTNSRALDTCSSVVLCCAPTDGCALWALYDGRQGMK